MSTLLSIKQDILGQFICSMRGHHSISDQDEDKLYESENNELRTTCNMCGISVVVMIEPKHPNVYRISGI